MIHIRVTGRFELMRRELVRRDSSLRESIYVAISRFAHNPHDTRLHNHALRRRLLAKWAFSVNDDIRIIYVWMDSHTIRLLAIGGHSLVYGKNV